MPGRLLALALLLSGLGVGVGHAGHPRAIAVDALERALFDPRAASGDRREALAEMRRRAEAGDAMAQYQLGALYRLGRGHPADLVDADAGMAARYLSNAAIQGQVHAMAGMAELRLAQGQAREAVVWALAYAHFLDASLTLAFEGDPRLAEERARHRAYSAWLAARCLAALADDEPATLAARADVRAFVSRYGETIRSSWQASGGPDSDGSRARWAPRAAVEPGRAQRLEGPGVAVFLARGNGRGGWHGILLVDSLPDARYGRYLRRDVQALRGGADGRERNVVMTISWDDGRYRFRETGQGLDDPEASGLPAPTSGD